MDTPLEWLLSGPAWIEYRSRLDLLGEPAQAEPVRTARRGLLADVLVRQLIDELGEWPGTVIASHKSAGQPFHKLCFLADLGLTALDPGIEVITSRILARQSDQGPFQLPMNIPTHYGGSGQEQWGWALCDAPLIVYAMAKFGLGAHPAVSAAATFLAGLARDNGFPCAVSPELGKFRGPGRKEDPCPYATLAMLKALSEFEEWRQGPACQAGAESLLSLWETSHARHPYMFFMGTDFRKIKVPFIWYDLMHMLDVLTRFPWLHQDPRLRDMLALLQSKMDAQGCFTNESVWTAWKEWEFGQKKAPSRWLTLAAWRILRRVEA